VDLLEALIDIRDEAVAVDENQAVGRCIQDAFKQVQPRPHFESVSGFQLLLASGMGSSGLSIPPWWLRTRVLSAQWSGMTHALAHYR
jgi:hypothetical protein